MADRNRGSENRVVRGLTALRFLAAALLLAAAGCSPTYVLKSWVGHRKLLAGRRHIAQVLADPKTPPPLKARLKLVEEIRAFAAGILGFPESRSYRDFVEVPRPYVTVAVTASRRTELKAYEWWFPIVGRVPYKGYFERRDAEREAERQERKGYDVYLMQVTAYSTLGWSADPVLSTMLDAPPHALAETLIHEMSHAAVYFKGQGDFNESMASFFGEAGSEEFVKRSFGEGSPEARAIAEDAARERGFDRTVEGLYSELSALYASTATVAEKLSRREEVFGRYHSRLGLSARPEPYRGLNNAWVLARRRYRYDLEDFRRAHARLGRDWKKTLALFKSLDRKRPREALRRWLEEGG